MRHQVWLAIIVLAVTAVACSVFVGGPAYPDPPVPVSAQAAQGLQAAIDQAISDSAQTGVLKLEISEDELTSYLAAKLEQQSSPILTEPQVVLRDGLMQVFGKAQAGIFQATVSITAQLSLDASGEPQIQITSADFGPLPATQALKDSLTTFLRETLTGSLGPAAIGFRLEAIQIADGVMTVTGRVK